MASRLKGHPIGVPSILDAYPEQTGNFILETMFVMLGTEMACPQPSHALPSGARRGAPRYPARR